MQRPYDGGGIGLGYSVDPVATYISPLENKIINANYLEMEFVAENIILFVLVTGQ